MVNKARGMLHVDEEKAEKGAIAVVVAIELDKGNNICIAVDKVTVKV